MILAAAILFIFGCCIVSLGLFAIAQAIGERGTELAAELHLINTHGLHPRNYVGEALVVNADAQVIYDFKKTRP